MTIDEMIAVLQAAKAGKQIQMRTREEGVAGSFNWRDANVTGWNFALYDYRVKPEPREWTISACTLDRCDQAYPRRMDDIIKVREVLE